MNFTIYTFQLVEHSFEQGTKYLNSYVNCIRVENTKLSTPIFRIKENNIQNIQNINYIYVKQLNVYYFVNKIEILDNDIIELYCTLDIFRWEYKNE